MRIDLAFKAFFRRLKAGATPGYPRFRGRTRYDSFCYPQSGFALEGHEVRLSKIGRVRLVLHRPLEGTIKTCCIRRTSTGKWFVSFACEVPEQPAAATPAAAVGIDVGLASFATLSTGEQIANPRFFRRDEHDLARTQRRLSKEAKCRAQHTGSGTTEPRCNSVEAQGFTLGSSHWYSGTTSAAEMLCRSFAVGGPARPDRRAARWCCGLSSRTSAAGRQGEG